MADSEIVAAILAAGMLQPISPPVASPGAAIEQDEQLRFVTHVLHAVGVYRAVLAVLGDHPKARRFDLAGVEPSEGRIQPSSARR